MALFRNVYTKFWRDVKIADDFTPEDKYFYLYLMTNDSTTLSGCYELSLKYAAIDTGYNEETVKRLLDRLERVQDVIKYDPETREVLLLNWHKYNWTKSKDLIGAVSKEASLIKNEEFRKYILDIVDEKTVGGPSSDGGGTTDADAIAINNAVAKHPPTVEEVKAYCEKRNNKVDAEAFIAYYESQGWKKANGQPVVDWKGCVRTWEQKDKEKEQPSDRTRGGLPYL